MNIFSFIIYPSDWSMECFLEYIIPKEISVEVSEDNENSYFNQ